MEPTYEKIADSKTKFIEKLEVATELDIVILKSEKDFFEQKLAQVKSRLDAAQKLGIDIS